MQYNPASLLKAGRIPPKKNVHELHELHEKKLVKLVKLVDKKRDTN